MIIIVISGGRLECELLVGSWLAVHYVQSIGLSLVHRLYFG